MGNEMEFGNPYYYQQGVVLNRPVQQRVVQQQQPYYNGNTLKIKLRQYDLFPGQVAEGTIILNNPGAMLLNDIYLHLVYIESWKVQGETIIAELNEKILGSICIGIAKILKITVDELLNEVPESKWVLQIKINKDFEEEFIDMTKLINQKDLGILIKTIVDLNLKRKNTK